MKHRIKIWPSNRNGQTIVHPTRFGDQGVVGNIDPVILKAVIAVEAAVPHRPAQKTHHDPEGVAFEYEVLE